MTVFELENYLDNTYNLNEQKTLRKTVKTYKNNNISVSLSMYQDEKTEYFVEVSNEHELKNFHGYAFTDYSPIYEYVLYLDRKGKLEKVIAA